MRTTPLQGLPWPAQCPLSHQPCLGLLNPKVDVQTHGGMLTIEWHGLAKNDLSQAVFMTGPATSVFEGEIDVPNLP
jgi:diaminopimelate epimerase